MFVGTWPLHGVTRIARQLYGLSADAMNRFFWVTIGAACVLTMVGVMTYGIIRIVAFPAILTAYCTVVGLGVAFPHLQFFCHSTCRVISGKKCVVLSFDDGPDPAVTPAVLDVLRAEHVQAVFFCIGRLVEEHPEIVRRAIAEGHLLGNHSFYHGWWNNLLFGPRMFTELDQCQRAIEKATGRVPVWYRPPVGLTNPHLAGALRRLGLASVGWDVRAFDRRATDPGTAIARVCQKARCGSVIALHDGGVSGAAETAILAGVITGLRAQGFEFALLDGTAQHFQKEGPGHADA